MKCCSPNLRYLLLITLAIASASKVEAQVPLPGGTGEPQPSMQMQQPIAKPTAPIPGNMPQPPGGQLSAYQQLPLNHLDAQTRIESLRQTISTARPSKELQESVYQLCDWLTDMANAHYKLSGVFAKHDSTKAQAELERKQAQKFSQLKNQAQLLKAELLIRQNRYPEALAPLVDIVANEPRSTTGQQAYKRLQQIGFSEEVQQDEPKSSTTETTKQNSASQPSDDGKTNATISRSTVSVEGYVGTPTNTATRQSSPTAQVAPNTKANVPNQGVKVPMPAPNQVLNVR